MRQELTRWAYENLRDAGVTNIEMEATYWLVGPESAKDSAEDTVSNKDEELAQESYAASTSAHPAFSIADNDSHNMANRAALANRKIANQAKTKRIVVNRKRTPNDFLGFSRDWKSKLVVLTDSNKVFADAVQTLLDSNEGRMPSRLIRESLKEQEPLKLTGPQVSQKVSDLMNAGILTVQNTGIITAGMNRNWL